MKQTNTPQIKSTLLRGTGIVSILNLTSRLLGLVRDLLSAMVLGAGPISDCFFIAFRIPNLLRSFLAEGALTSGFVPTMSEAATKGKSEAQELLHSSFVFFGIVTLLIAIAGILYAQEIIKFIAPGISDQESKLALATLLLQIMFPYLISISLLSLINGALNTYRIFGAAAWGQIIVNIFLIIGAIVAISLDQQAAAITLAISFLIGGVFQIIYQLGDLKKIGLRFQLLPLHYTPAVTKVIRLMIPAAFGAAIYQITILLMTLLASLLPEGSVSWLYYADRVSQLPIGIFTIALSSVLLPTLATASANKNNVDFELNLSNSLRYTSFLIIPLTFGLYYYAQDIISLLFERGAFSEQDSIMSALAIQASAFGLWAISIITLLNRAMIAKQNTLIPALLALASLIVSLVIALLTMGPIETSLTNSIISVLALFQIKLSRILGGTNLSHIGLAFATGAAATLLLPVYAYFLKRVSGFDAWRDTLFATYRALAASALTSLVIFYPSILLMESLTLRMVTGGLLGIPIYLFIFKLLGGSETAETLRALARLTAKISRRTSDPKTNPSSSN